MDEVYLELPYPPTVNHYYKTVRTKFSIKVYVGNDGVTYREAVQSIAVDFKVKNGHSFHLPCFELCKIKVHFKVYPPDHRKRDLDNLLKCLCDSLQHAGIYKDDNQIDYILIERCEVIKGGKVTVFIERK